MTLAAGAQLGPYEILSPLGKGGMGEVYRARDTRLDRDVAVKVLPEGMARDEIALARFSREAKAVAALSHPNILAIYDVGEADGISYVVTELLEGETLRERLSETRMSWRQAIDVGAAIADGLAAAHAKGIIHRDLKPENIFLTDDGVVKILDFGLARMQPATPSADPADTPTMTIATSPGTVMGTIQYMSPEQVRGLKTDEHSDIFSFGCVLYEMVTGERAFKGKTSADTMTAILREEPPSVTSTVRDVSPEMDRLVSRCLNKKAERRFQSASDLAFTLRSLLTDSNPRAVTEEAGAIRVGARLGKVVVAVLLLVVGFFGWREWRDWRLDSVAVSHPIRRIAVLPLENRSGDPRQDMYVDAMTEALTDALAQISALYVISPRTMLRLKDTELSIPELAKNLGVDAFVTASWLQDGEQIQIRARLVEGATERLVWSEHYERDKRDVLAMQNEIALAVANGIKVKLTPTEQSRLADAPSIVPRAYDLYVEGLELVRQGKQKTCEDALVFFDRAIAIDPNFALAHAGRAKAYYALASTHARPSETMPRMREAAENALALNENLPEAYVALGQYRMQYEWDWDGAREEFERAVKISPSSAEARVAYADYLTAMKRHDEALAELAIARERDPVACYSIPSYGGITYNARRYKQTIRDGNEALRINPENWSAHQWMGLAMSQLGQFSEAIAHLRTARKISESATLRAMLGGVLAVAGQEDEARTIRKRLKEQKHVEYICPYEVATISIGLREYDQAFDEIHEACDDKAECIPYLQVDPRLDPIRDDPRFDAVLERVGFEPQHPQRLTASAIPKEIRLAVLPFQDLSPQPKQWFADAMTGELISTLAKIKAFNVRSRRSSMRYKKSDKPLPQIARELNANMVIDATVSHVNKLIRISVDLIDAATDTSIWSGSYYRNEKNVLALQNEVARSIAEGIQLELSARESERLTGAGEVNPSAYDAYLQGRFYLRQASVEDAKKALTFFEQSARFDPQFALAYAGQADALTAQETYYLPPREVMPRARAAALKAIELDDSLAEAHASLGKVLLNFDWDWDGAEREFQRALDLNPGLARAHVGYALLHSIRGRFDEAIPHLNQAKEYDPYSITFAEEYGLVYYLARDYETMVSKAREAIALDPDRWVGHTMLGLALAQKGDFDEAIDATMRAEELNENPAMLADLGGVYALAGKVAEAREVLDELTKMGEDRYVCPYRTAAIYVGLDEHDEAFERFGQACEDRSECMPLINYDPRLDSVRDDPRFDALVECVGLKHKPLPLTLEVSNPATTTLAVLPFQNLSTDPDAAYLADEIPASIIDGLATLSRLRVVPRSTAFRYEVGDKDIASIGRDLNSAAVLTGQINARGTDVRIRVELVDVLTNQQLWSARFDRTLTNVVAIEEDITARITRSLRIEMTGAERSRLKRRYPVMTEAHTIYLRGRSWWNKRGWDSLNKSIEFFDEAIRIDPQFALALAGKAEAYCILAWAFEPQLQAVPKARDAAKRALALNPDLAEAYAALGWILMMFDWDWIGASEAFEKALSLDPDYATGHSWHAAYHLTQGNIDAAESEIRTAQRLDPDSMIINRQVGMISYIRRDFDAAIIQLRSVLEIDPGFQPARHVLGLAFLSAGRYDEAIAEMRDFREHADRDVPLAAEDLGRTYARSGQLNLARAELRDLQDRAKREYVAARSFGLLHAELGNMDEAFRWMNTAVDDHESFLAMLKVSPTFDVLRDDVRFDDLLRRIGLTP